MKVWLVLIFHILYSKYYQLHIKRRRLKTCCKCRLSRGGIYSSNLNTPGGGNIRTFGVNLGKDIRTLSNIFFVHLNNIHPQYPNIFNRLYSEYSFHNQSFIPPFFTIPIFILYEFTVRVSIRNIFFNSITDLLIRAAEPTKL